MLQAVHLRSNFATSTIINVIIAPSSAIPQDKFDTTASYGNGSELRTYPESGPGGKTKL